MLHKANNMKKLAVRLKKNALPQNYRYNKRDKTTINQNIFFLK